jgi:hypothetical protein
MNKQTWYEAFNMAIWLCVDIGVEPTSALKQAADSYKIDDIESFVTWGLKSISD